MSEDKIETWSVRVNSSVKKKINKLADDSGFVNREEFITHLLSLYKLDSIKENAPDLAGDLNSLKKINEQIINIFTGMGEKMAIALQEKDISSDKLLTEKNNKINELQEKYNGIKIKTEEEIKIKTEELEKNKRQLENLKENIETLRDNNIKLDKLVIAKDTLSDQLLEEKEVLRKSLYKAEERAEKLEEIALENDELKNQLFNKANEINTLKRDLDDNQVLMEQLQKRHEKEIEILKEKLENQKERALLDIEKEYQKLLNEKDKKYQALVEEYHGKMK